MSKPVAISGAIVTLAAGFAVASIATSGSLAAIAHVWSVTTSTTRTVTTGTNPGDRHIEVCREHWNHHHHHRWFRRSVIDQHLLTSFLHRGFILAPCSGTPGPNQGGGSNNGRHGGDDENGGDDGQSGPTHVGTISGTSTTGTFAGIQSLGHSNGHGDGDGHGESHGHGHDD